MAVAYDNIASSQQTGVTRLEWSHTITATTGLRRIFVFVEHFGLVRGCTYAGLDMLLVDEEFRDPGYIACYSLDVPTWVQGAQTVSFGATDENFVYTAVSISVTGADAVRFYTQSFGESSVGTSHAVEVLGLEAGDLVIAGCVASAVVTITEGGSQTERVLAGSRMMVTTSTVETNSFTFSESTTGKVFGLAVKQSGAVTTPPPVPGIRRWWERTLAHATSYAGTINSIYLEGDGGGNWDEIWAEEGYASYYYDAGKWFLLVAKYCDSIGNTSLAATCRTAAVQVLTIKAQYELHDIYRVFSEGYLAQYREDNLTLWQTAIENARDNSSFEDTDASIDPYLGDVAPRENAYAILLHINARAAGIAPRSARYTNIVNWGYDHLDWFFVDRLWVGEVNQFSPFMMGLLLHALYRDWEFSKDTRYAPAAKIALDYIWTNGWRWQEQGIRYNLNPDYEIGGVPQGISATGSPDLNTLIAHAYARQAVMTGDPTEAATNMMRADLLFASGQMNGSWVIGKQGNQLQMLVHDGYFEARNKFYAPVGSSRRSIRRAL